MKKCLSYLSLAVITAVAFSTPASAGARATSPVSVLPTNHLAYGNMGTAHDSTDSLPQIGCSIQTYLNTASVESVYMTCWASNAAGAYANCYLSNPSPAFIATLSALNDDSFIQFYWDDAGRCRNVYVQTSSAWEPKKL